MTKPDLRLVKDWSPLSSLKMGGGDGTSGGMSEIVDAKIAASEARTDAKFVQVLARLESIEKSTQGLRLNTWLAAATALGLAIAAMALGAAHFGNGVMVTTAAVHDAAAAKRVAIENAEEVRALRQDISALIQSLRETTERSEQGSSIPVPMPTPQD